MTIRYFSLTIKGQQINIAYTPNKFADCGHFEFFSPHEPRRCIPISKTGYLSHFAPMWEIKESDSPEAYAGLVIKALINSQGHEPDEADNPQLTLF